MRTHHNKTASTLSNLSVFLNRKLSLVVILSLSIFIMGQSCKKGDVGPAGPAGATGAAGSTGATGATGATGTANVIYSDWFTPGSYTKDTVFGTYGFYYDKATTA